MGLFDKFKKASKPEPVACQGGPLTICAPVDGHAKNLEDAPDPVFAQKILGDGIVIKPSGEVAYAPFDGTITAMMGSGHGVGLLSEDGIEVLIHIGVDTVQMKGEGFEAFVKQGESVKGGQPLIRFSKAKIKKAGHPDDVMVLVSNTAEYGSVNPIDPQPVKAGQPVITVSK